MKTKTTIQIKRMQYKENNKRWVSLEELEQCLNDIVDESYESFDGRIVGYINSEFLLDKLLNELHSQGSEDSPKGSSNKVKEISNTPSRDTSDYTWKQLRIIHCPMKVCKGMLLECDESYDLKCSDCKNRFDESQSLKLIHSQEINDTGNQKVVSSQDSRGSDNLKVDVKPNPGSSISVIPSRDTLKYPICKTCGFITCECQELSNCCGSTVIGDVCQGCKEHSKKVRF